MAISDDLFVARHGAAQLLFWSGLYYLFPAVLAAIAADTGWPAAHLAYVFTAAFLVWAALSPLVGRQIDYGRGEMVMTVAGVSGAGILVMLSLTESFTVFAAGMIGLGAAMAATLYDPCFALMLRRFGQAAGRRVAAVTLIAGMATLLTFPLVAVLLTHLSWRSVLVLFAAGVVLAVFLIPRGGVVAVVVSSHPATDTTRALSGAVLLIGVSFAAIMFSHAALLFTLPSALQSVPNFEMSAILLPAVLGPSQIAGRLAWNAVSRYLPAERAAGGLFLFMLVPPLLLIVGPPTTTLVLFVLGLQGAGYGVHTILRPMLAARFVPVQRLGRELGRIAMIGLILMAIAPAAAGFVSSSAGLSALLWLLVLVNMTGLAMIWWLRIRHNAGSP